MTKHPDRNHMTQSGHQLNPKVRISKELAPVEILLCSCHSTDHQLVVGHNEGEPILYLHVHLCNREHGFWRRLVLGTRYIFGRRCRHGHWDEFIFSAEDADRLQAMADFLRKDF